MYQILLLPVLSGLIAQGSKFLFKSNKMPSDWKSIFSYSGMPSSHAAVMVSLTTIVGLVQGIDSPIFAVSFIFSFIVIRDALGIRRYLGQHGEFLNILIKDLGNDKVLDQKYPRLLEKIGHTPAQILVGGLIGLIVSLLGYLFA